MGFSFTVSPVSRIGFMDWEAYRRAESIPDSQRAIVTRDLSFFANFIHKTPPDEVERWWTRTEEGHAGQLNERLR